MSVIKDTVTITGAVYNKNGSSVTLTEIWFVAKDGTRTKVFPSGLTPSEGGITNYRYGIFMADPSIFNITNHAVVPMGMIVYTINGQEYYYDLERPDLSTNTKPTGVTITSKYTLDGNGWAISNSSTGKINYVSANPNTIERIVARVKAEIKITNGTSTSTYTGVTDVYQRANPWIEFTIGDTDVKDRDYTYAHSKESETLETRSIYHADEGTDATSDTDWTIDWKQYNMELSSNVSWLTVNNTNKTITFTPNEGLELRTGKLTATASTASGQKSQEVAITQFATPIHTVAIHVTSAYADKISQVVIRGGINDIVSKNTNGAETHLSETFKENTSAIVQVTLTTGAKFTAWQNASGSELSQDNPYTISSITSDVNIYPIAEMKEFVDVTTYTPANATNATYTATASTDYDTITFSNVKVPYITTRQYANGQSAQIDSGTASPSWYGYSTSSNPSSPAGITNATGSSAVINKGDTDTTYYMYAVMDDGTIIQLTHATNKTAAYKVVKISNVYVRTVYAKGTLTFSDGTTADKNTGWDGGVFNLTVNGWKSQEVWKKGTAEYTKEAVSVNPTITASTGAVMSAATQCTVKPNERILGNDRTITITATLGNASATLNIKQASQTRTASGGPVFNIEIESPEGNISANGGSVTVAASAYYSNIYTWSDGTKESSGGSALEISSVQLFKQADSTSTVSLTLDNGRWRGNIPANSGTSAITWYLLATTAGNPPYSNSNIISKVQNGKTF